MMVKGTVVVSVQDPDENKAKNEASNARAYLTAQRYVCGNVAVTRTKSRDQFGAVAHTTGAKFVVQGAVTNVELSFYVSLRGLQELRFPVAPVPHRRSTPVVFSAHHTIRE